MLTGIALTIGVLNLLFFIYLWYRLSAVLGSHSTSSLSSILKKHHLRQIEINSSLSDLETSIQQLDLQFQGSLHKQGFTRFNPHPNTGGDQSFALCLLNSLNDGVLLTAVHGRETTRIYAKPVKLGKVSLKLSPEEERVLEQALQQ